MNWWIFLPLTLSAQRPERVIQSYNGLNLENQNGFKIYGIL